MIFELKKNRLEKTSEDILPDRKKILFIDDNDLSLEIYKEQVEGAYIDCHFCSSSLDAIEYIKNNKIDGVVSDLVMPQSSGMEILKAVNSYQTNCLKVLVTGSVDINSLLYAINELDVDRIYIKPLPLKGKEFIKLVQSSLRERG